MKNIIVVFAVFAAFVQNVKAQISIPYVQNFENLNGVLPTEIKVVNNDVCRHSNGIHSGSWQIGGFVPNNDIVSVTTGVYTDANCASDDWLILGKFTGLNRFAMCKWETHSWHFAETFLFYVSTDSSLQSFLQVGELDTFVRGGLQDSFYQDSISLSAWAGQDIYVAFRCISASKFALGLDNIKVVNQIHSSNQEIESAQIKIYPTLAQSFVNVSIDAPQSPEVLIYNLNGQLLQRKENDWQRLDISHLAAGVYVVEVRNGKNRTMQRVFKF
jgi:Secretion system C-terminal sorting domain